MIEHVLLKTQPTSLFSTRPYTEVRQDGCARAHLYATDLERGPALAAIVALEALK